MMTDRPGADPHRRHTIATRLEAGVAGAAAVVAALTWGAIPWSWGFAASYLGLSTVVTLAGRRPQLHMGTFVQIGILSFATPVLLLWFYGQGWAAAALHVGSIALCCVMLGSIIGERIPSIRRAKEKVTPRV